MTEIFMRFMYWGLLIFSAEGALEGLYLHDGPFFFAAAGCFVITAWKLGL